MYTPLPPSPLRELWLKSLKALPEGCKIMPGAHKNVFLLNKTMGHSEIKQFYVLFRCMYIHMNTNATYRTRRLWVRGAVNGFIGKSGSQERNMFR